MRKKTRRDFIKTIGIAAAGTSILSASHFKCSKGEKHPNVILIMSDDQGYGDIGIHGNKIIETPVLDKLASESVTFNSFYVSSVCAPTRASLLTGRYYMRTGVHGVTRGFENIRVTEVLISEVFKANGYTTGCFGKWHNGFYYPYYPNARGFDEFFGFCGGVTRNYFNATIHHNGKLEKSEGYITDVLTDYVIKFIDNNKNKPFFAYVPYNVCHSPNQVPDKYFDKYKEKGLDDGLASIYGMIENMDENIGRLLKHIERLNLSEDTIVLFLTDNGANGLRYNAGMKGNKGSMHEGGVRVPLFIRWPGHIKGSKSITQLSAHIDLLPTLVELCGIKMIETLPLDGVSLVPLINRTTKDWKERIIFHARCSGSKVKKFPGALRTKHWRAVNYNNKWELYDMKVDAGQENDVAEEYPEVVKRMSQTYNEMYENITKNGFEPLPAYIGNPNWPEIIIPLHEARLEPSAGEGISYIGKSGWAHEWITDWIDKDSYAWLPVNIEQSGKFEVTLKYVCAKENLGCKVQVDIEGKKLEAEVKKEHDPEPVPSPDRTYRGGSVEKEWADLLLGTVDLEKGGKKIIIRMLEIPGKQACDLKDIVFKLLK